MSQPQTPPTEEEHNLDLIPKIEYKEDFIPEIEYKEAINGVIELKITNIVNLWGLQLFDYFRDTCFKVIFRRVNTKNQDDHHPEIDGVWKSKHILVGSVGYDGTMYFKTSVYLNDYDLEFCLQTMHKKRNKWMTKSTYHTINIPSFLQDNSYKIGEQVSFRDKHTFHTSDAEIKEILNDNMFKIKYLRYDTKKQGPRHSIDSYIETTEDVHISRLYHKSTDMQYEIDLINTDSMLQNVLIQRNDNDEGIRIFNAIKESLKSYAQSESVDIYGTERCIIHWKDMNHFVTKNVFDFLYKPQFQYFLDCLLNGEQHHHLNMINLRQSDIRTKYELIRDGIGNVVTSVHQHDNMFYSCDWCRFSIKEWNFVYQCIDSRYIDRHDYCQNCVNTVIRLNQELSQLLNGLLHDQLIYDCIQVIVDCVIGRVVCMKFNNKDDEDNADVMMEEKDKIDFVRNKRKIDDVLMPVAKRRKLNSDNHNNC